MLSLPQRRANSSYNMCMLQRRICIVCLSYCETLGPMLPWCVVSVIVAAVALAEVDQQGFAGRDQPRTELIGTAESLGRAGRQYKRWTKRAFILKCSDYCLSDERGIQS
jgi:hypothetical protein